MKKIILFVAIIVTMLGSTIAAQDYIVQVGYSNYTAGDIQEIMQKNGYPLPEIAIRKLARDEALKLLKKDRASLYKNFFGADASKDDILADAADIPLKQQQALARKQIFNSWLDRRANTVPVKYLNIIKFWEVVKETASYKVRAESGMKLDYTNIPYTFAELQVAEGKTLAQKGGVPFLESAEFNDYVAANYPDIQALAKRNKPISEVRNLLVKIVAGQKILADQFDLKQANLDDIKIERLVASFINGHVYDDDPELSGITGDNPSDMRNALLKQYESRNQKELSKLRQELKGEPVSGNHPFKYKNHLRKAKLEAFKSKLTAGFTSDMIYKWMAQNKFPGNVREAQFVMTNAEYENSVDKALKDNNIIF